ncbi:MAG TPA: ETC complex I subunit [Stellaceae bacterium]|nr:ETC complex I subunit [Stellaceae bacterium]
MPEGRMDASFARNLVPVESAAGGAATLIGAPAQAESAPRALIYQPCRSAMSSGGKATPQFWVLEFEPQSPSIPDPLMGWSSSADTLAQTRLKFPSREAAIAYASRNAIAARVVEPHRPKLAFRSYASNFIGKGAVGVSGRVGLPDNGELQPGATQPVTT